MKPKWLIERDTFKENIESIQKAIVAQGMEFKVVTYVPFYGAKCLENTFNKSDCVIFYGSLNLAKLIQKQTNWIPGVYCNLNNFECTQYYAKLGRFLLNDKYIMLPYGELIRQKDFLFETLGNNDCLFLRPSSGFKYFTGTIVHKEKFEKEVDHLGIYDISPEKIVVVSDPKNLAEEWRLIVVDKRVIAWSLYKNAGEIIQSADVPAEVIDYGNQIVSVWQPDIAFTLDICRVKSGHLRLVEINSFSCSGFYACNVDEIVKNVSTVATKEWEEYYDFG